MSLTSLVTKSRWAGRRAFHPWRSLFHTTSRRQDESLRILFCGADPFSIESLKALHAESRTNSKISSIQVVTKTDKRTGRGLKQVTSPPIKAAALDLGLPIHQIDTFTGWTPPPIDLVVAVSFGLLIPPRILNSCKYAGLNVHPSLLPALRGAAPIQWTIIEGLRHTGVSIQTLHPSKFDEGVILDQTPPIEISDQDTVDFKTLRDRLAPIGAELLVKTVRNGLYLPPYNEIESIQAPSLAPRINTSHMVVDFQTRNRDEILKRSRAVLKLFAMADRDGRRIRVLLGNDMRMPTAGDIPAELRGICEQIPNGVPYAITDTAEDIYNCRKPLFINTRTTNADSACLVLQSITVAGSARGSGAAAAARAHLFGTTRTTDKYLLHMFGKPLSAAP